MHLFGTSLAENCYGHKMPVLGEDKLDRKTIHFQSLPLSQKHLLFIKLVRENNKTFKKHFTRKEAHVVSFTILDMLKIFASLLNIDVDECNAFPNICGANTDCHNTDGSYTCICKAGYTGDGKTCSGMDFFHLKLIVFTITETFLVH